VFNFSGAVATIGTPKSTAAVLQTQSTVIGPQDESEVTLCSALASRLENLLAENAHVRERVSRHCVKHIGTDSNCRWLRRDDDDAGGLS